MLTRILGGLVIVVAVVFGVFFAWQWRGELPPVTANAASFDPGIVAKGAVLAAVADCAVCHTQAGGKPYAGGFPVKTPFGIVYGTNITPDRDTGIGTWSEAAFRRALREGVGRKGTHFYPAFPYDHFTNISDGDISALYAFLMTREPVHQPNRPTRLSFPLNWRPFAAAWNLLYLRQGPYRSDPGKSAEWNRGAYLVAGAGHCSACHTPHNALGAETKSDRFGGGEAEDWYAPALDAASPAPVPWTVDELYAYLRTGYADQHGFAAGPMQPVVLSLRKVPDADVHAIATFIASISGPRDATARKRQTEGALAFAAQRAVTTTGIAQGGTTGSANTGTVSGATLFAGACASCHHSGGGLPISRPVALGLSTPVNEPDPTNFLRIVLDGIQPPLGHRGPIMPSFSGALTDPQIDALADYVRTQYSRGGRWTNVTAALAKMRQQQTPTMEAP